MSAQNPDLKVSKKSNTQMLAIEAIRLDPQTHRHRHTHTLWFMPQSRGRVDPGTGVEALRWRAAPKQARHSDLDP